MTDFDAEFIGDLFEFLAECIFARFPIMSIILILTLIGTGLYFWLR